MGFIYRLIFPNGKSYIGQTTLTVAQRFQKHQSDSKKKITSGCRALNAAIRKYDWKNLQQEVLLEINDEMLDFYEKKFIIVYDSLAPNGYNLVDGGNSNKTCSKETKQKISEANSKKSRELFVRQELSKNLPRYLRYIHPDSGSEGFHIQKHPKCASRYFIGWDKTLEEKKKEALEFLAKINRKEICKLSIGYEVVYIQKDGKKIIKTFDYRGYTQDELLDYTIEHLDWLISCDESD